ncbi:hypothetical protein HAX54_032632 [Datura stramonium]|uniref:Uncharacterized protein n=1 Tax=Datura stramonium TaxID=4076 RepID=A0ABS8VE13_DATST|nr:hypothetical protein [Datura stramonium]
MPYMLSVWEDRQAAALNHRKRSARLLVVSTRPQEGEETSPAGVHVSPSRTKMGNSDSLIVGRRINNYQIYLLYLAISPCFNTRYWAGVPTPVWGATLLARRKLEPCCTQKCLGSASPAVQVLVGTPGAGPFLPRRGVKTGYREQFVSQVNQNPFKVESFYGCLCTTYHRQEAARHDMMKTDTANREALNRMPHSLRTSPIRGDMQASSHSTAVPTPMWIHSGRHYPDSLVPTPSDQEIRSAKELCWHK